jgi:polyhydroxyalkanoate synthesis regulator protein
MLSRQNEIALLQSQIKHQEFLFDKSMNENEDFAKTKLLFNELKKMIEKLDELKKNGILNNTENHQ